MSLWTHRFMKNIGRKGELLFLGAMLSALLASNGLTDTHVGSKHPRHNVTTNAMVQLLPEVITAQTPTLEELHNLALRNNPTLVQACSYIRSAQGAAFQAGRYPNPVIGYTGEQIGTEGTAGEMQGAFLSQEFVTGGKLRLSRAKYQQRVHIASTYADAQQRRVLNNVTILFYHTLIAQELANSWKQMLGNGEDRVQTVKEMFNLGQANQAGILQAEVDLQGDRLNLIQARRELQRSWRELASVVGVPEMTYDTLSGLLGARSEPLNWPCILQHTLEQSPVIIAARQKVRHFQIAVRREQVEPIPNITAGMANGYDFETRNAVANVNIAIVIPLYNRNRGSISQAEARLMNATAEVKRLELTMTRDLAAEFQNYEMARVNIQALETAMLPKSRKAYHLLLKGYHERRATWPTVLEAQRKLWTLQMQYLSELRSFYKSEVLLCGMLLTDGLGKPDCMLDQGHIDSTSTPR